MCAPTVGLIYFNSNPTSPSVEEDLDYKVDRVAKLMKEAGCNVHVIVLTLIQRGLDQVVQGPYRCHTVQKDGNYVHRIESMVRSSTFATQNLCGDFYSSLRQLHLDYRFDVFHLFSLLEVGYVATLLAKEYGVPVVHSVRGSDFQGHPFNHHFYSQIRWTLENSDWVTFTSQDVRRSAISLDPTIGERSSVVVESVTALDCQTPDLHPCLASAISAYPSAFVIGAVGPFRKGDGIEYLMDACAYLNCSMELSLVLIGDFEAEERSYWDQEIADSGLGDRLRVTGSYNHSQVLASLPYLDALVMPSTRLGIQDSCARILPEAMLSGCPIVGTAIDVIADLLGPEKAGLLVKPEDSGSLMSALWQLAQQPMLCELLGARAKRIAQTRCAPSKEQREWAEVYQRTILKYRGGTLSIENPVLSRPTAVKSKYCCAPVSNGADLKVS